MLFSGYLLAIGRRFSMLNAVRLLRLLRRLRLPVFTTDPFLGLAVRPGDLDFRAVLGRNMPAWARWLRAKHLATRIVLLERLLRDCWHVYASPLPSVLSLALSRRALSYCSDPPRERPVLAPGERPRWLFVLSDIDWRMQVERDGDFPAVLAQRLGEACALGRHPVLVAPAPLVEAVRARLGAVEATLLAQAPYSEFMRHLMSAEYALYWNYFSFSLMHRVLAGLPVLWFAEGHMMSILPSLRDAGLRLFYDGWTPPLLDLAQPLRIEHVAPAAEEAHTHFVSIARRLRECGSPATLLRRAMASTQDGDVLDPVA